MKKIRIFFFQTAWIYFLFLAIQPAAYAMRLPYLKNELRIGYYNRGFIYLDCPRPPNPIFWSAKEKVKFGVQWIYSRLVYNNKGRFGVVIGAAVSRYGTFSEHTFVAETIYPELRYWFIRTQYVDLYLSYSVAGPTILSRRVIDGKDLGGYFIFQDFLGLGMSAGRHRAFTLDVRLVHYSNGDIFPKNPGFDVPIVVYLGYSF